MEQVREQTEEILDQLSAEQLELILLYAQCVKDSEQVELKTGETVLLDDMDLVDHPG